MSRLIAVEITNLIPEGAADWVIELQFFIRAHRVTSVWLTEYPRAFRTKLFERDGSGAPTRDALRAAVELLSSVAANAGHRYILLSRDQITALLEAALIDVSIQSIILPPGVVVHCHLGQHLDRFLSRQRKECLERKTELDDLAKRNTAS